MSATVQVELTPHDLRAAASRAAGSRKWLVPVLEVPLLFGCAWVGEAIAGPLGGWIGLVLASAAVVVWAVVARRRLVRPKERSRLSPEVTVDGRGVTVQTAEVRSEIAWSGFRRGALTPEHLFLWRGAHAVLCIPLRCFTSNEIRAEFLEIVAAHLPMRGHRVEDMTPL